MSFMPLKTTYYFNLYVEQRTGLRIAGCLFRYKEHATGQKTSNKLVGTFEIQLTQEEFEKWDTYH